MATYGRIEDNKILEIFIEFDGWKIWECFHPDVAKLFTLVPDGTVVNSIWDGEQWVLPDDE